MHKTKQDQSKQEMILFEIVNESNRTVEIKRGNRRCVVGPGLNKEYAVDYEEES